MVGPLIATGLVNDCTTGHYKVTMNGGHVTNMSAGEWKPTYTHRPLPGDHRLCPLRPLQGIIG